MSLAAESLLLLPAATPDQWVDSHLISHFTRHGAAGPQAPDRVWLTRAELLAADAAVLRRSHEKVSADDDASPAAAAKWLAGWFPGALADAVGFTLAAASAALLLDGDRVRWRMDPGGWPDLIDPAGAAVAVRSDHPWAGQPGVLVLPDDAAVAERAVRILTTVCEPLVLACRRLARVGLTTLWTEVADSFGMCTVFDLDVPVDPAAARRINLGLTAPGARWRQRPDLWVSDNPAEYLGRKAGCCLSYQCPPGPELDLDTLPEKDRAYYQRYPLAAEPRYCSTCSLRDLGDCADRQTSYLQLQRAARD